MAGNKNIIQTISEKEMDRKDFLKYSGLALLSLFGFTRFINFLAGSKSDVALINKEDHHRGFGSGKYGM